MSLLSLGVFQRVGDDSGAGFTALCTVRGGPVCLTLAATLSGFAGFRHACTRRKQTRASLELTSHLLHVVFVDTPNLEQHGCRCAEKKMDALLQTLGILTWNYALKSGFNFTSQYAAQQCSRLLKSINDKAVRSELRTLQKLLDLKIKASPLPNSG